MLGDKSAPRSTDTSAETTAPMADNSIHDRLQSIKASPLVDQTRFKFVGSVNFLLRYTPEAQSTGFRSGEFGVHSIGDMKSGTFRSRKATVSGARFASARPVERQNLTLGYPEYVWQQLLGKKIVAIVCPIPFDTRLDKMDFSAAINELLFKRYVKLQHFCV